VFSSYLTFDTGGDKRVQLPSDEQYGNGGRIPDWGTECDCTENVCRLLVTRVPLTARTGAFHRRDAGMRFKDRGGALPSRCQVRPSRRGHSSVRQSTTASSRPGGTTRPLRWIRASSCVARTVSKGPSALDGSAPPPKGRTTATRFRCPSLHPDGDGCFPIGTERRCCTGIPVSQPPPRAEIRSGPIALPGPPGDRRA